MSGSVPATTLAHSRCNSTLSPTSCSDTPQSVAIYTPASSPSPSPQPSPRRAAHPSPAASMNEAKSEPARAHEAPPGATSTEVEAPKPAETAVDASIAGAASTTTAETPSTPDSADGKKTQEKKTKAKNKKKKKKKQQLKCKKTHKHKKVVPGKTETDADAEDADSDDSDDAESAVSSASSSDSSDSSSAEEKKKKKSKAKKKKEKEKEKAKAKKKAKKNKKSKKEETSSDSDSDSDSSSDSDSEDASRKKRRKRRARKAKEEVIDDEETTDDQQVSAGDGATLDQSSLAQIAQALQALMANQTAAATSTDPLNDTSGITDPLSRLTTRTGGIRNPRLRRGLRINRGLGREVDTEVDKPEDGKAAYKRVDQIWDTNIHDYRLQETAKEQADAFEGYVFHVRRKFDWENKYRNTIVDIKSKYLREALQEVMKDVRAISLVENEPSIDPNMLFLYLEEMRTHYKKTLKERIKKEKKKKKIKKRLQTMREHLKLMVGYLDKDYDQTKKTLGPMLKAGNITFDLIWALFRPNSIAYTTTYGANDHPRCFKVDQAYREKTFMRGEFYVVEGRYLEYDGKNFGLGEFEISIDHFKGPKKITQLATYPLEYHKEPDVVRTQLIERGKKFVSLAGMNFKFMKGMAFQKKKKQILKFNINGRVMIDPKTFRRENANYQVSTVRTPEERDDDDDSCDGCCSDEESDDNDDMGLSDDEGEVQGPTFRIIIDENNKTHLVEINGDEEEFVTPEKLDELGKKREFTEEELLISSSIVLGFSFNEKQWFEFSVSGIGEIVWDDKAFDSLVLDPNHKSIVKAQVCSHKFHSGETIDDVIQGKGKGLVFVLHGPPGVGKTLTAEGIAEFLRCPLYAVSAGDLGTDARIEHELNKIMAIAHSWGAVLLLDEADVFLEKRQHQDVHRNALVSVFLRLLEYFQGILFLTTNRVETFDEAFQSRIHIALKYSELGMKAKKEIWRMFLGKVKETGGELANFRESDYERLAKSNLNGRQIKNMVKTAQALAVFEKTPLNMEHVRRVLDVGESFERDLKGGTGFEDAMRSYT